MIGKFEFAVLSAVINEDEPYGVPIRRFIEAKTGKSPAIGAIYTTLSRLENKGYVTSKLGEATAVRGGRAKKIYSITSNGRRSVIEFERAFSGLTSGGLVEGDASHA